MSIIEKYSYFMINITSVSSKDTRMVIEAASEKKKALHSLRFYQLDVTTTFIHFMKYNNRMNSGSVTAQPSPSAI